VFIFLLTVYNSWFKDFIDSWSLRVVYKSKNFYTLHLLFEK
jgi:hypothetical protein